MERILAGIMILRTPNGGEEKAVGLYAPATPELIAREEAMLDDLEALRVKVSFDYIEARRVLQKQDKQRNLDNIKQNHT